MTDVTQQKPQNQWAAGMPKYGQNRLFDIHPDRNRNSSVAQYAPAVGKVNCIMRYTTQPETQRSGRG